MTYLDNAATSWPKPVSATAGLVYGSLFCTSPGRGGHRLTDRAEDAVYRCREAVAELFNVDDIAGIAFTHNATHALNMAIKGLYGTKRGADMTEKLKSGKASGGGEIVISGYEHNSVLRPCRALEGCGGIGGVGCRLKIARSPLFNKRAALEAVEREITAETELVVINHVSNVFGYILPVYEIGEICRKRGIPLIVDASQSAGAIGIDMKKLGADCVCMPGHKGLMGAKGTGILICRDGEAMNTVIEGGTGSHSLNESQPDVMPERMESGTQNVEGITALLNGIKYVTRRGIDRIFAHERELIKAAAAGINQIEGARAYFSPDDTLQAGVLSFTVGDIDSQRIGQALCERDVAVRAGLHCAPLAHGSAGTLETGTVRVSPGIFNTHRDIRIFLSVLRATAKDASAV